MTMALPPESGSRESDRLIRQLTFSVYGDLEMDHYDPCTSTSTWLARTTPCVPLNASTCWTETVRSKIGEASSGCFLLKDPL